MSERNHRSAERDAALEHLYDMLFQAWPLMRRKLLPSSAQQADDGLQRCVERGHVLLAERARPVEEVVAQVAVDVGKAFAPLFTDHHVDHAAVGAVALAHHQPVLDEAVDQRRDVGLGDAKTLGDLRDGQGAAVVEHHQNLHVRKRHAEFRLQSARGQQPAPHQRPGLKEHVV